MTWTRMELVDIVTTLYYHCICRCVRRTFLCGKASATGKSYEHRKPWFFERLKDPQSIFTIALRVCAGVSNRYSLAT